jgi:hypothetical protein
VNNLAQVLRRQFVLDVGLVLMLCSSATLAGTAEADPNLPQCVQNPGQPTRDAFVSGFPGERLYLHPQHPVLCRDGSGGCAPAAYVVAGDRLLVTASCDGWSLAAFKGPKKTGWVATRRLEEAETPHFKFDVPADEGPTKSVIPACAEAQATLNQALSKGEGRGASGLPNAIQNEKNVTELPNNIGSDDLAPGREASIGDAQIKGRPVKVIRYDTGGSCHDGNMELWTPDLAHRFPVSGSNPDGEPTGYSSDDLVQLHGEPYFAHSTRSGTITLYAFEQDLSTYPVCVIAPLLPAKETIKSAPDPAVCNAVLENKVVGAPIDDIEPSPLGASYYHGDGTSLQLVGRGRVDIDNDGHPDDVGIVEYSDDSGAGCGHEYRAWWPIKLNADGTPAIGAPVNEQAEKVAGDHHDSRLFTFRGATYYERRSRSADEGIPEHDVWKFTPGGAVQACVFNARYEVVRTSP